MNLLDLRHRLSLAFSTGATSSPSPELSPAVYAGAATVALGVGGLLFWATRKPADPRDAYVKARLREAFDERSRTLSFLGRYYDVGLPRDADPKKVTSELRSNVLVRFPNGRPYASVTTEPVGTVSAMFYPTHENKFGTGIYRAYGDLADAKRELDAYERGGFEEIAARNRRDKAKWSE